MTSINSITFDWSIDGTDLPIAASTSTADSGVILAGETSITVTVETANDDDTVSEMFTIELSNVENAEAPTFSVNGQLQDDDAVYNIDQPININEGDSGSITMRVPAGSVAPDRNITYQFSILDEGNNEVENGNFTIPVENNSVYSFNIAAIAI